MTIIQKNDFIEIEFTGKANNEVFDTTNKQEAKQMNPEIDTKDIKPLIVSVGNQMLLKGFDDAIEGKETNKKYSIHLEPEQAFGKRDPSLIKIISMKTFREKNINPVPGLTLQMDNYLAKILSVSGGRITVDFNNQLAGKEIDYDFKITKKIEDNKEKISALQDFFFKQRFEFEIDEKNKKVILKDEKIKPLVQMMAQKFKDMTGFDFEVKEDKAEKPGDDLKKIEKKK
jgi:FKBP-type peptidyl-prolyl cis-trans isomerase SlyD